MCDPIEVDKFLPRIPEYVEQNTFLPIGESEPRCHINSCCLLLYVLHSRMYAQNAVVSISSLLPFRYQSHSSDRIELPLTWANRASREDDFYRDS